MNVLTVPASIANQNGSHIVASVSSPSGVRKKSFISVRSPVTGVVRGVVLVGRETRVLALEYLGHVRHHVPLDVQHVPRAEDRVAWHDGLDRGENLLPPGGGEVGRGE